MSEDNENSVGEEQNEAHDLSTKKLKKLIKKTEATLEELKQELGKRKLDDQHEGVDHLEEHMKDAEHNLANIVNFMKTVFSEKK
jgi:hypothetical protein